jgi:hypothetical protein
MICKYRFDHVKYLLSIVFGLMALTINTNGLAEAHSCGSNLWELVCEHVAMLHLSLALKGFSDLLKHKPFWNQFCTLRVDQIHLLYQFELSSHPFAD